MTRTVLLLTSIALVASCQGCCNHLCRHTGGACDCYAPPVESLLQAPCPRPGHPSSPLTGAYAPAPHGPYSGPQATVPVQTAPAPVTGEPKPAEPISVLPKIVEKEKEKDK